MADSNEEEARIRRQREAARRLALLGGTEPNLELAPRRRPPDFISRVPETTNPDERRE